MEKNEYKEYLTKRARGIRKYMECEDLGVFRKVIADIKPDYEFVKADAIKINDEFRSHVTLPSHIRNSLYFNKINEDACREITTGRIFYRTHNDSFYNEESGLHFNFYNYFEKGVAFEEYVILPEYKEMVRDYFDSYIALKREDDIQKSKAQYLLLKKGVDFTKK